MKRPRLSLKGVTKKIWFKYVGFGFLIYLGFVVVMVPANRVYGLIQPMLQERNVPLQLYGVEGTIWDGSTQLAMVAGKPIRNIHWDLNPTEVVLGQLSTNIDYSDRKSTAEFKITRSFLGNVRVKDVQLNLDISELLTMLKIPFVKLDGTITGSIDQVVLADKQIQSVEGKLMWKDAGTRVPQKQKLGDLIAQIETGDKGIRAVLKDAGGPLELNGEFQLQQNGTYSFNGQLMAREGANSNLGRTLMMFGRMMPDNKVVVNTQGNLAELGLM